MGPTIKIFTGVVSVLLLASCQQPNSSPRKTDSENKILADQTMERMKIQSYGVHGLEWQLSAPKADVYSESGKTVIQNLEVELFDQGQKSTNVTADEGLLFSSSKNSNLALSSFSIVLNPGDMFLNGHVVMVSTEGNHLATDWAHYKKKEDLIVSQAPVKVSRPDSVTHGVGLEATADLSKIKIFNQTLIIKGKPESSLEN